MQIMIKPKTTIPLILTALALAFVGLAIAASTANGAPGDLFATDPDNHIIYKFTPDGTQSTFATGLNTPIGLAFDGGGNLFAADGPLHGTIYKFAPDGTGSTFAAGLEQPYGLAFDSAGNLFVSDFRREIIYKFTPDGTQSTFVATGLNAPSGLAFDSAGNLFEADYGSGTIYKFAPDGTRSSFATGLSGPTSLAFQPGGTPSYAAQIQPPINADGTSVFSARRGIVPVKFTLTQGGIATCDLPPATIAVTRTGGGVTGQVNESVYSDNADTGSNFRIDNCQYVYNLNSRALGIGTYRVDMLINGQVVDMAVFQLN
jgi:hypothetical protein